MVSIQYTDWPKSFLAFCYKRQVLWRQKTIGRYFLNNRLLFLLFFCKILGGQECFRGGRQKSFSRNSWGYSSIKVAVAPTPGFLPRAVQQLKLLPRVDITSHFKALEQANEKCDLERTEN